MALLTRKKVKNVSDAGALLKNMVHFEVYRTSLVLKFFNSSERCSFWQTFCIILIFFTFVSEASIYDYIIANFAIGFFWIRRIGSGKHRAIFPILNLASIHVEAFDNTVLLWLAKEFFLPDITTYRHRRNWTSWTYHMCRGIKSYSVNVIFLLNALTKHVTEANHLKHHQAI